MKGLLNWYHTRIVFYLLALNLKFKDIFAFCDIWVGQFLNGSAGWEFGSKKMAHLSIYVQLFLCNFLKVIQLLTVFYNFNLHQMRSKVLNFTLIKEILPCQHFQYVLQQNLLFQKFYYLFFAIAVLYNEHTQFNHTKQVKTEFLEISWFLGILELKMKSFFINFPDKFNDWRIANELGSNEVNAGQISISPIQH